MRSLGNANYWHKVTQGFPPECLNCPTPPHCRSEPEGTAGYSRTAVEGPVTRTVAFNLAIRKSSVLSRRLTHPFGHDLCSPTDAPRLGLSRGYAERTSGH